MTMLEEFLEANRRSEAFSGIGGAYDAMLALAEEYEKSRHPAKKAEIFAELLKQAQELPEAQRLQLAELMAMDCVTINATENAQRSRDAVPTREQFAQYLSRTLKAAEHAEGGAEAAVKTLHETLDRMLVSLVHTMHPTVFHTPEARRAEKLLANWMGQPGTEPDIAVYSKGIDGVLHMLRDEHMRFTPFERISLGLENATEEENIAVLRAQVSEVAEAWNAAVAGLAQGEYAGLGLEDLTLTPERIHTLFEFRTWGRAADADGREFATSMAMYDGVLSAVEGGAYTGPALDLRQNAEQHRGIMDAIIQKHFNNDASFYAYCRDFLNRMNDKIEAAHDGSTYKYEAEKTLFSDLRPEHRVLMLKEMMQQGHLLFPEALAEETLKFNAYFRDHYQAFLREHELSPLTGFQDIPRPLQAVLKDEMRKAGYALDDNGLGYGTTASLLETRFLYAGTKKAGPERKDGSTYHVDITGEEQQVLIDIPKRLGLINHFIDTYGPEVATRHQIANFETPADFYSLLYLFEQTGLVTIERGAAAEDMRVTSAKLHIQPLLETVDDLKRAEETFRELLKDPLVLSYYQQALGNKAQVMVGYSDGAKSAGCFASEWEIHKASRALTTLFAEHGIELQVLQGRGRGEVRGGLLEPGDAMREMSAEMADKAVLDVTIQGDQPMHMATSAATAQQALAGMMVGIMDARQQAASLLQDEGAKERRASYDVAKDFIASRAGEIFQDTVKGKASDALKFVKAAYVNPERSSRKPARGGSVKDPWDSTRAITTEYGFMMGGLPAHYAGLKKALEEFVDHGPAVRDEEGAEVTGQQALAVLYRSDPFFRAQMNKTLSALRHYDPALAGMYGKMSGSADFVASITEQLDGLSAMVEGIARSGRSNVERVEQKTEGPELSMPLCTRAIIAQALEYGIMETLGKKPSKEHDPVNAATMDLASFCAQQSYAHQPLPRAAARDAAIPLAA